MKTLNISQIAIWIRYSAIATNKLNRISRIKYIAYHKDYKA